MKLVTFALAFLLPLAIIETAPRAANANDMSARAREFAYCLRGSPDGGMRCNFNSRAQCTKAANRGGSCIRNPRAPRA